MVLRTGFPPANPELPPSAGPVENGRCRIPLDLRPRWTFARRVACGTVPWAVVICSTGQLVFVLVECPVQAGKCIAW